MRRLWGICLLFLLSVLPATQAQAGQEKRVALVVGNNLYRSVPRLDNPANDARLIATTLKGLGFTLVGDGAQLDLDHDQFVEALRKFRSALSGGSIGVFYYAGHGLQVDGVNYLVPVDANPSKPSDVDDEMIDANRVLRKMQDAGTSLNIVMLDACRNNPFRGPGLRATSNGLVEMQALEGTLISFATSPGTVADDGDAGANGPYAVALAEALPKPGLDVFQTFNEVNKLVYRHTGKRQQPWMSSSPIEGEFYFAGQQSPAIPSPPAPLLADEPKTAATPRPAAAAPSQAPASSPAPVQASAAASTPPPAPAALPPPKSTFVIPAPEAVAVVQPPRPAPAGATPAAAAPPAPMPADATKAAPASAPPAITPPAAKPGDILVASLQLPAPSIGNTADPHALDAAAWDAIKSSSNQADFQAYLNRYPNGDFAGTARSRIDNLQSGADDAAAAVSAKAEAEDAALYHGCWDAYKQKNYADAMPACRKAADHGDAIAIRVVGALYDDGLGVARDRAEAARWYRMAADKGDADAANDLGVLYANGSGVTRDYAEALRWTRMAAEKGNIASAMHNVGYFYDNGWGIKRDYAEALRWYRMAADKGNVPAMNDLGALYGNGHGVPTDYAEALRWYRMAADQGNANAMNNLGALYANGLGASRDYAEALRWYRMAADKGNVDAMNNLGLLYYGGKGVAVDYGEALRWFHMAADKGNAVALRNLGDLYASGEGVPRDLNQAKAWYQKAIDLGDNEALDHLKKMAAHS